LFCGKTRSVSVTKANGQRLLEKQALIFPNILNTYITLCGQNATTVLSGQMLLQ